MPVQSPALRESDPDPSQYHFRRYKASREVRAVIDANGHRWTFGDMPPIGATRTLWDRTHPRVDGGVRFSWTDPSGQSRHFPGLSGTIGGWVLDK